MGKRYYFKILSLCLVIVLFSFSGFLTFAQDYVDFSIDLPQEYVTAFKKDDKTEIADIVNIDKADIEDYFSENSLEFLSVAKDNSSQIKLSVFADDFSAKIKDFNNLDDERLLSLSNSFFTGSYEKVSTNVEIVTNNNLKFLMFKENLSDSGGEYTVTQFVTVYGEKTYRLSVFATALQTDDFTEKVFESFSIKEKNEKSLPPIYKVMLISGILVFSAIIILTVVNIVKIYKNDEN